MESSKNTQKSTDTLLSIFIGSLTAIAIAILTCFADFESKFTNIFLWISLSIIIIITFLYLRWRQPSKHQLLFKLYEYLVSSSKFIGIFLLFFTLLKLCNQSQTNLLNTYYIEILLISFSIIFPTIMCSVLLHRITHSCPIKNEIDELRKSLTFSVTGTCIPLHLTTDNLYIETFINVNPNYNPPEWMFPGGHAYTNGKNPKPEDVAKSKALEEAKISVDILNIENSNELEGEKFYNKTMAPHFTYIFNLRNRVDCFHEKGHRYHYDCVYIGEITSQYPKDGVIPFKVSINENNFANIRNELMKNMHTYAATEGKDVNPENVEYVALMLYNALLKYKEIKKIK